jgi:hypothetical protein
MLVNCFRSKANKFKLQIYFLMSLFRLILQPRVKEREIKGFYTSMNL